MLHMTCKGKDGLNNGETELLKGKEGLTAQGNMFIPFLYSYPLQAFLPPLGRLHISSK